MMVPVQCRMSMSSALSMPYETVPSPMPFSPFSSSSSSRKLRGTEGAWVSGREGAGVTGAKARARREQADGRSLQHLNKIRF